MLESRLLLAVLTESANELRIQLSAGEQLEISSEGYQYVLESNQLFNDESLHTEAFQGLNTKSLRVTDLTAYTAVRISSNEPGNLVTFADSASNFYQHDFQISISNSNANNPSVVEFHDRSSFENFDLNVTTSGRIHFHPGSTLQTVNGDLSFRSGLRPTEQSSLIDSIAINLQGAEIRTEGTGAISLATTGGSDSGEMFGLLVQENSTIASTSSSVDAGTITLNSRVLRRSANTIQIAVTSDSTISSVSGDIRLTSTTEQPGPSIDYLDGIVIKGKAVVQSTGVGEHAASIFMEHDRAVSGDNITGITVAGTGTAITTIDGDVFLSR